MWRWEKEITLSSGGITKQGFQTNRRDQNSQHRITSPVKSRNSKFALASSSVSSLWYCARQARDERPWKKVWRWRWSKGVSRRLRRGGHRLICDTQLRVNNSIDSSFTTPPRSLPLPLSLSRSLGRSLPILTNPQETRHSHSLSSLKHLATLIFGVRKGSWRIPPVLDAKESKITFIFQPQRTTNVLSTTRREP